ncbi:MAG: DUF2236 domain-containing protein [Solirubrobacterales bacterium]|nr:DUF2236 domain-containing protein [Solirubrobacterales bacterium]
MLFPSDEELERLLVGPESVAWQFGSDTRLWLVMLYPLLLQVAHPTVGAAVSDHSNFEQRPWDRLVRSIDWLTLLVYGGPEAAAAGRKLRALHKRFRGTREDGTVYSALDREAYAWVHATLLESYVAGHAQFGRRMSRAQLERFYGEYRGLGRLAGVRERDLPGDWRAFRAYFDRMVAERLARNDAVERVLHAVARPTSPLPSLPDPVWRLTSMPLQRALWLGGIGLMPPILRARLGIGWSWYDRLAYDALGRCARALTPALPERLLVTGPAQLRARSDTIARGPLGTRA